jgi:hypothetical protein
MHDSTGKNPSGIVVDFVVFSFQRTFFNSIYRQDEAEMRLFKDNRYVLRREFSPGVKM